jgi:hypothetical protein
VSKFLDDIVICLTVALSLIIALFLAYSLVERGANYPPTLITIFLGICVAALTYRFLGGTGGNEFSIGALKLCGSAALLLGTTYFVGERIRSEQNIFENFSDYRQQIKTLKDEAQSNLTEITAKNMNIARLEKKVRDFPSTVAVLSIDEIKKLSPNDPLIQGIKQLVSAQDGPFRQTIRDLQLRVAIVAMPNDEHLYSICSESFTKLYEGVTIPNTNLLASRSVGQDANSVSQILGRRGKIADNVCAIPTRDFDVQIGCATAMKLFADKITNCGDGGKLRGEVITIGALPS